MTDPINMSHQPTPLSPGGQVVGYNTLDGAVHVDVRLEQETVWLTQWQMAAVFQTSTDNVSFHLKTIFANGELSERATTEDFSVVQSEGQRQVRRSLKHYNLDAIISVGYRVNSKCGVRFRQWATHTLREHLGRGFTLNERRLAEQRLTEARAPVNLLARTLKNQALADDTGQAVLYLIVHYYMAPAAGIRQGPAEAAGQYKNRPPTPWLLIMSPLRLICLDATL